MDFIDVPVQPHVLKFLQYHLGDRYQLTEDDPFGAFLYVLMRRPTEDGRRDHVLETYQGKWRVHYGSLSPAKHGLRLTGKVVHAFNKFVDGVLKTEMCGYVDLALGYEQKIKFAIVEFMRLRGVTEDDIQYETLYKHYQRSSNERKASKKRASVLRSGRPLTEVRQEVLKMPLPSPPQASAAA